MITRIFYPAADWWVLVEAVGDKFRYALINPITRKEEYSADDFDNFEIARIAGFSKRADLRGS